MTDRRPVDEVTGVETTGHEWDGIRELDNPLPRWWVVLFYATIVGSIIFYVLYPSWPIPGGDGWTYTRGIIGTTPREDVARELAEEASRRAPLEKEIAARPLKEILEDPKLSAFALAGGRAAFGDNCAPCHGTGAEGGPGFPNLNDDEWLWGGHLEDIYYTIKHGVRWESDPETRMNVMQGYLKDGVLTREQVQDVVQYVLSLSGRARDSEAARRGEETFATICSACHGPDGKGNPMLGAPDLTNDIWLYGGDEKTIFETVAQGRAGQMPAWGERLSEAVIKELALYVYSLGGGVPDGPAAQEAATGARAEGG